MTTQRSFLVDGMGERFALPEIPPTVAEKPDGFDRLKQNHPWCLEWIRDYLRREVYNGAKSVGVRKAMEACRHTHQKRFGEDVPGVGRVGLNNNHQIAIVQWLYQNAPDLRPCIRRRAG